MTNFRYTRPDALPPIVKNLVIINVLVYIIQITVGKQYDLTNKLALYPVLPARLRHAIATLDPTYYGFHPFQIATHMFTHSPETFFHIIFNMFALWMFGRILENVWGPKRFLLFYLLCGVGAAAFHLGVQYFRSLELLQYVNDLNSPEAVHLFGALGPALGASGAVMGVLAAFAYLFPNTELYLMFIPVPIKAKWAVLGYVLIDLLGGIGVYSDNIAHFAHLGGAITGFLLVLIFNKSDRRRFY
jgi:membrane associated rhomboid family serine protease